MNSNDYKPKYSLGDKVMCVDDGLVFQGKVIAIYLLESCLGKIDYKYDVACHIDDGLKTIREGCMCPDGELLPDKILQKQMRIVREEISIEKIQHNRNMRNWNSRLKELSKLIEKAGDKR